MDVDMDCMIYVDAEEVENVLRLLCASLSAASESSGKVTFSGVLLYGAHNDYEADGAESKDFTQWPSVLECEPLEGTPLEGEVHALSAVLRTLWDSGFRAVAACDFEDQLPEEGGLLLFSDE